MVNEEVLKKTQQYISCMARGINPVTGEMVADDDSLNNVHISRCLFCVDDILKELIKEQHNEKEKPNRPRKAAFVYDQEKIDLVRISNAPISLSQILRNIKTAYDGMIKITYQEVATYLFEKGVFIENAEKLPHYIAAPNMQEKGIYVEKYFSSKGFVLRTLFNEQGQRYLLELLKDFAK